MWFNNLTKVIQTTRQSTHNQKSANKTTHFDLYPSDPRWGTATEILLTLPRRLQDTGWISRYSKITSALCEPGPHKPHYIRTVRKCLENHYLEQWIRRRRPSDWLPRSPDLTPLVFLLRGNLKSVVFETHSNSVQELHQRILQECKAITPIAF